MVDAARAYRRWARRHIVFLGVAVAGTVAVELWIGWVAELPTWFKIPALSLGALILLVLAVLSWQTLRCAGLHIDGCRRDASSLRRQLASYRGVAISCLVTAVSLLIAAAVLPVAPPAPAAPPATVAAYDPSPQPAERQFPDPASQTAKAPAEAPPAPTSPEPTKSARSDEPPPAPAAEASDATAARPKAPDSPSREEIKESPPLISRPQGVEAPPPTRAPSADLAQEESATDREEGFPSKLQPRSEDLVLRHPTRPEPLELGRLGMPSEGDDAAWTPPELRFDLLYLRMDDAWRGGASALALDVPLSDADSVCLSYQLAMLGTDPIEGDTHADDLLRWQRSTVDYKRRLFGYTRHASFDLAVNAGFEIDTFNAPGEGPPLDLTVRFSPHLGVELALWEAEAFGLILHAGKSVPLNLSGVSADITDLSATFRLDISNGLSIHAGYRVYLVRLKVYGERYVHEHGRDELDETLAGPFLGIDLRF